LCGKATRSIPRGGKATRQIPGRFRGGDLHIVGSRGAIYRFTTRSSGTWPGHAAGAVPGGDEIVGKTEFSRRNPFPSASAPRMLAASMTGPSASASPGAAALQDTGAAASREADVVVIGAGAAGLPAAVVAREAGASVIVLEAENHIGGHAITSGGNVPLGGGTSAQKKHGIEDSPDLLFRDLTDWSVVEPNGFPDYRYNDREIIRAFADHNVATYNWLVAHGVVFVDQAPDARGGNAVGNSVPREMHAAVMDWPMVQTGKPADPAVRATMSSGNGLMRPLEAASIKAGVRILLGHRMVALHRNAGRVDAVTVRSNGTTFTI
jgi:hypothetical protein